MLASFLTYSGFKVDVAANGREALQRLDMTDYDACLMDIQMPVMTGDEAIRRIRSSSAPYRNIPILALTADASQRSRDNILAQGASAFFAKPFELAAILAKLESLTESYRKDRSADERRSA